MSKTFRAQLNRAYHEKVILKTEKAVRAVALVVDRELVLRTPVDTGRARANWIPSLNQPIVNVTILPNNKREVSGVLSTYTIDDTVFISNNLPYIEPLNNGSSKQAPAGFVEAAVQVGRNAIK